MKTPATATLIPLTLIAFLLLASAPSFSQVRLKAANSELQGPNLKVVPAASSAPDTGAPRVSGEAYITGFQGPADRAIFHFKAKQAGLYKLAIAYRCQGRKSIDFEVNDLKITGMLQASDRPGFTVQDLGTVEMNAGQNQIVLDSGWGYFDVDYIEITPVGPLHPIIRPVSPASDPHATPEAQALLAQIDDNFGKVTLLGVYTDKDAQYVEATTGVKPAVMGGDLMRYSPTFVAHGSEADGEVERLIADAQAGSILTLSWHWSAPFGLLNTEEHPWYRGFRADATTFDVARAMAEPDSRERLILESNIDEIAVQLRKFQDAHIPVLWRPLHEAQDETFWWGAKGSKPFVQLWQLLFDRLVNKDGIHNLIWVFTSEGDPAWYPGDAFVDVIGIDAYPTDIHDPQSALWNQLTAQFAGRKPLAISEFGGVPDIPRMQRMNEFWAYAISWSDDLGPRKNTVPELKRIYGASPKGAILPQ